MVYYKLVLNDKRITSSNLYPLEIRVTHNRKNTSISTGVRIRKADWNSASQEVLKSNPNFQSLNKSIQEFYLRAQKCIHTLVDLNEFSFELLKENLKGKPQQIKVTFFEYAQSLINNMLELNQTGNALVYQTAINRFFKFTNRKTLKFADVDYNLLNSFKEQLQKDGVKQNTISNYFRTLKAIYNKGIKAKHIDRSKYPFYDISIKSEKTLKRALSFTDFKKVIQVNLKDGSQEWNSRNYLLISFCLIGISFTDIAYLKKNNINKERIIYRRRKTGKELSVKITPFLKELLAIYNTDSNYLLPIVTSDIKEDSLEAKKLIHQWIKTTNKYLNKIAKDCKIEEKITTYVSRHTWATSAKRLGYSNEMIAQALGHEYGNKITNIYLDGYDYNEIDKINDFLITKILNI